jgi:uncharacterized protein
MADLLSRVFYHNLQDILSMALLGARMVRLFEVGRLDECLASMHSLDCASLARCYSAVEWWEAGEAAYRVALERAEADGDRALIFRELGAMLKRLDRRDEAAAIWEEWITSVSGYDITPYVELAKYHEWQTRDYVAARGWAAWAVRTVSQWPPGYLTDEAVSDLSRRLQRLERKLGGQDMGRPDVAPPPEDL